MKHRFQITAFFTSLMLLLMACAGAWGGPVKPGPSSGGGAKAGSVAVVRRKAATGVGSGSQVIRYGTAAETYGTSPTIVYTDSASNGGSWRIGSAASCTVTASHYAVSTAAVLSIHSGSSFTPSDTNEANSVRGFGIASGNTLGNAPASFAVQANDYIWVRVSAGGIDTNYPNLYMVSIECKT